MAVDMMAIVRATQAALPLLKESKGNVVNTSSISALRTSTRTPPYGAIKAAVIHYTATQAAMYARDGIRVNGVAPGSIEFPGGSLGEAQERQPEPLQRDPALDPVRPAGPSRGSGERGDCSWPRRWRRGSPARRSWSMAGSCCDLFSEGVVDAVIEADRLSKRAAG